MLETSPTAEEPELVPVAPPRGLKYLFGTWSGRILLVNTLVFLFICIQTRSILLPDTEALIALGAKDPVRLAQGDYWRLLTPVFLHIGIIHFAFNSYFLYVVGYQLERLLGGPWFVACYLVSGIMGNLASAAFSVHMSAGASGALFGLLGAGLFLERLIGAKIKAETGRRPRQGAYLKTVAINLGLGLLLPFIDNSAHLGGLFAGLMLTGTMVFVRPNQLQRRRVAVGLAFALGLLGAAGYCAYASLTPSLVVARLVTAAAATDELDERVYHLSQALELDPTAGQARLMRLRTLFKLSEANLALRDARTLMAGGGFAAEISAVAGELEQGGHQSEAWELRRLLAHRGEAL